MRRHRNHPGWPTPRTGPLEITCTLPSDIPGRPFQLHLTGQWEELPAARRHHDPRAAATHHALTQARHITEHRPLTEHPAVEAHINAALATARELRDVPVRLLWARAQLTVTREDLAAAVAFQRQEHEAETHDRLARRRLHRAQELHTLLSTTPLLALAYWFSDHPETLDENTIDRLERLVTTVTAYTSGTAWVQVARLLQIFVQHLDQDARKHLIDSMAQIFTRYDQPDLAHQLRTVTGDSISTSDARHGPE